VTSTQPLYCEDVKQALKGAVQTHEEHIQFIQEHPTKKADIVIKLSEDDLSLIDDDNTSQIASNSAILMEANGTYYKWLICVNHAYLHYITLQ